MKGRIRIMAAYRNGERMQSLIEQEARCACVPCIDGGMEGSDRLGWHRQQSWKDERNNPMNIDIASCVQGSG